MCVCVCVVVNIVAVTTNSSSSTNRLLFQSPVHYDGNYKATAAASTFVSHVYQMWTLFTAQCKAADRLSQSVYPTDHFSTKNSTNNQMKVTS